MPDFPNAAHHIVAGKAPSAEAARQILLEYGVDIDDAANGVFLPTINNPDASVGAQCSTFRTVCSIRWLHSVLIPFVTAQSVAEDGGF